VLLPGPPLLADAAHAYPDLTELAVAAVVRDGAAALELSTPHPYATGFRVTESGQEWSLPLEDPVWTVSTASSGEHRAEVATVTPYGAMPFSPVTYRVS
jgi:hypothetical protein